MVRVADERRLAFDVKVPSPTTHKAIAYLESGKASGLPASIPDCRTACGRLTAPHLPNVITSGKLRDSSGLRSIARLNLFY
ncbi:MAG: hypothetical protein ABJA60_01930 [Nitrosospira sp.]